MRRSFLIVLFTLLGIFGVSAPAVADDPPQRITSGEVVMLVDLVKRTPSIRGSMDVNYVIEKTPRGADTYSFEIHSVGAPAVTEVSGDLDGRGQARGTVQLYVEDTGAPVMIAEAEIGFNWSTSAVHLCVNNPPECIVRP